MTKRALLDREDLFVNDDSRRSMWVSLIHKFYHGGLDGMTEGKTYDEIAGIVDDYVQVRQCIFLFLCALWANFSEKWPL
jgi:hypothetical protein